MGDGKWLSRGIRRKQGGKRRGKSTRYDAQPASQRSALGFEALEDRRVLATYLVTNFFDVDAAGDTILGSLRWAIESANADEDRDSIVFSENAWVIPGFQNTISLNGGVIEIEQPVDILGPGARKLVVDQVRPNQRVFDINIGADDEIFSLQISGMTISGGNLVGDDEKGGGIYNRENLTMYEAVLSNNSAPIGGAIFNEFGRLTLERSTLEENNAGRGGGIANGPEDPEEDGPVPQTFFRNSTARLNTAGQGGALFNNSGRMFIEHSTITENEASEGAGVASWGNPAPDEEGGEPPPPTVWTYSTHSIIYGNEATGEGAGDFDRVGTNDEGVPLLPSVFSRGWNFVGTGNTTVEKITVDDEEVDNPDWTFGNPAPEPPQEAQIDYVNIDPELADYGDYGGSMDVYMLLETSPAIDAGNPELIDDGYEQRGRHFARIFNATGTDDPIIDVGSVEVQLGTFVVDTLIDETNGTYSELYVIQIIQGIPVVTSFDYETEGNFSIREALEFATKNPGLDTIEFSTNLISAQVLQTQDLTASRAPTILLKQGSLPITEDTIILGPDGFVLEIDASGNDSTPNNNNGDGSRVFMIDDFDAQFQSEVYISNLTLMGADTAGNGGGIFSRENLTLSQVTLKDNNASNLGGGLYVARGDATILGTTLNANRAAFGAGVYIDTPASASQSKVAVLNSTFSGNLATSRGAAIYNNKSDLSIHFSTITLNNAGFTGSGVYVAGADALTSVWASAISGNTLTDFTYDTATSSAGAIESLGDNYIGRGNGNVSFVQGGDRRNANTPMLAPLFNTGGLVETHRPLAGSPLIDTGPILSSGSDPAAPEFDGRGVGFTREFDGNLDGTVRADVGAYELQGLTLKVDSPNDENDGITTANNFSLREAIQLANENPLPDIIEFDPGLLALLDLFSPQDPVLFLSANSLKPGTPTPILITDDLTINGPGQGFLAIDGSNLDDPAQSIIGSRMFIIDDGNAATKIEVVVNGLEFRNAHASAGGSAFYSKENLTLNEVTLLNNRTYADPTNLYTGLHGGAVYQESGKLTVNNSLVTGNTTSDVGADGGAIYVVDGQLELNGAIIAGNSTKATASEGGAIHVKNSTFVANASVITGNLTFGGASDGGGFFSDASVVTLNETTVSGNTTVGSNSEGAGFASLNSTITLNDTAVSVNDTIGNSASGAGAFISGGTLVANRSQFRENSAIGIAALGAGIANFGGAVTLNYTSVTANRLTGSGSHGAGVANIGGVLVVRNSTISENVLTHSQSKGGGVYSDTNLLGTQSTLILNSTISTNTAPLRGGGVFNADGLTEIKHSTITNNASGFLNVGSGVASQGNAATQTKVLSSIIAGNVGSAAGTGSDVDSVDANFSNSFISLGYNVIGTGNSLASFNQIGDQSGIANPLLGPLDSNGQAPNLLFELQTHALLAGSPAINAGSPAFNPNAFTPAMTTDQRGEGFARVKSGRIDAGAFESDLAPALPADFNGNGKVDGADFLTWQRNFGKTGGIKADGDANGDGNVNTTDLAIWKTGFGSVAASGAASSSASFSSSAALIAEEEEAAASAPATEPNETSTATAVAETPASASRGRFGSLASLGRDSVAAKLAATPVLDEAILWNAPAAPTKRVASVFLDDEKSADLDLLLADEAGSEAEDAVFAAWGEELL